MINVLCGLGRFVELAPENVNCTFVILSYFNIQWKTNHLTYYISILAAVYLVLPCLQCYGLIHLFV